MPNVPDSPVQLTFFLMVNFVGFFLTIILKFLIKELKVKLKISFHYTKYT